MDFVTFFYKEQQFLVSRKVKVKASGKLQLIFSNDTLEKSRKFEETYKNNFIQIPTSAFNELLIYFNTGIPSNEMLEFELSELYLYFRYLEVPFHLPIQECPKLILYDYLRTSWCCLYSESTEFKDETSYIRIRPLTKGELDEISNEYYLRVGICHNKTELISKDLSSSSYNKSRKICIDVIKNKMNLICGEYIDNVIYPPKTTETITYVKEPRSFIASFFHIDENNYRSFIGQYYEIFILVDNPYENEIIQSKNFDIFCDNLTKIFYHLYNFASSHAVLASLNSYSKNLTYLCFRDIKNLKDSRVENYKKPLERIISLFCPERKISILFQNIEDSINFTYFDGINLHMSESSLLKHRNSLSFILLFRFSENNEKHFINNSRTLNMNMYVDKSSKRKRYGDEFISHKSLYSDRIAYHLLYSSVYTSIRDIAYYSSVRQNNILWIV